jgi:hypothetical protein
MSDMSVSISDISVAMSENLDSTVEEVEIPSSVFISGAVAVRPKFSSASSPLVAPVPPLATEIVSASQVPVVIVPSVFMESCPS